MMEAAMYAAEVTTQKNSFQRHSPRELGWLRHIGLLTDYLRIPFATGSSLATQFLYREFRTRGHDVTVIGPHDPDATPHDLPHRQIGLPAIPLRNHPGVLLPMPTPAALSQVAAQQLDLLLGQTGSELAQLGVYLRLTQRVPFLCVNTVHLRTAYHVLLPDSFVGDPWVQALFGTWLIPWIEQQAAMLYNQTDGLVVLCKGLERFWRDHGVRVPIHVIPRSVDPRLFDRPVARDPFHPACRPGARLLCVCRHSREKSLDRLISTFARHIAGAVPEATLTLVGDGPDHDAFRALAVELGVGDRVFFPGEYPVTEIGNWYRHADLFLYMSLSETYGQVVSEAMWCGLPVIALADQMGVSHQIDHGTTGLLITAGADAEPANAAFSAQVRELLAHPEARRTLGERAREQTRLRVHPERVIQSHYDTFEHARRHCRATLRGAPAQSLAAFEAIARWSSVHSALAALGYLRSPVVVNRHGRRQPTWDDGLLMPPARLAGAFDVPATRHQRAAFSLLKGLANWNALGG
jgi:1,2-diacylglycerol 3-alpha-glucosyltransferase